MIVLKNSYCEKCPCKKLEVVSFNLVIMMCNKCKESGNNE